MNAVLLPHTAVGEAVERAARAKLYHMLGYKVYVASSSQLKSNREAYEFLFQKNPYISGEKSVEHDDAVDGIVTEGDPFRRNEFNPRILKRSDFTDEDRVIRPFYRAQPVSSLKDKILLDLNISSYRLAGGRDSFGRIADYVRKNYPNGIALIRENYDLEIRGFEPLPVAREFESITYRTIYDYCDIVSSAAKVVCLQTGSQFLACAYNRKVDCLRTEEHQAKVSNRNRLLYFDCDVNDIDLR